MQEAEKVCGSDEPAGWVSTADVWGEVKTALDGASGTLPPGKCNGVYGLRTGDIGEEIGEGEIKQLHSAKIGLIDGSVELQKLLLRSSTLLRHKGSWNL